MLRAFHGFFDQASRIDMGLRHAGGQETGAQTTNLGFQFGQQAGYRKHILPRQQADGEIVAALYRIGHRHGPVATDQIVAQWFCGGGERVMGGDGKNEVQAAHRLPRQAGCRFGFHHYAQREVGLTR